MLSQLTKLAGQCMGSGATAAAIGSLSCSTSYTAAWHLVSSAAVSSSSSASSLAAVPWRAALGRRLLATGPGADPKSVLGTGHGMTSPASQLLEKTAQARMQNLKVQMDAPPEVAAGAAGAGGAAAGPGMLGTIGRVIKDALILGTVGTAGFVGYYTFAYNNVQDLEIVLDKTRANLAVAEAGGAPAAPAPTPIAATQGSPAAESGSGSPPAFPPLTRAWCWAVAEYISWRRAVEKYVRDYTDPTYHKLLPDMAPELKGRVKTLVLDLDDVLIHKEWTRHSGWKIYKRPGVQDFLLEMGGYYELVLYTDSPATYAEPIINKLDPQRMVMYRLYRPETQYHNGKHVRDLSKLNRDLSQVLFLSANPDSWEFQPENTLKLRPWKKDITDTTLLDLIPMLQLIATKNVGDVRDVVKAYDGESDIPKAFRARMASISKAQTQPKQRSLRGMF